MSFDNGKVREWIGPRIVPVFADDVEWDITKTYEPLIMVQHEGETFMSRQYVPAGIQLPDTAGDEESNDYWVHMSNWNAQVEYYRQEVLAFDGRIDTLEDALPLADFDSTNTIDARFDTIEANGWVTSQRIADGTITTSDIANGAITGQKIANDTIKNTNLETLRRFKGCSLACIGDSFLDGWTPSGNITSWGTFLAQVLGVSNHYDYKQGNSGYHRFPGGTGTRNFYTMLDELHTAHPDVDLIVIGGGWNDIHTSRGDSPSNGWLSYGINFAEHARSLFPNAYIACFLPLCGYFGYGINLHQDVIEPLANGLSRAVDMVYTDCWDWLWHWNSSEVSSDGLHPALAGQWKIGSYMASVLGGGHPETHVSIETNPDSDNGRMIMDIAQSTYGGITLFRDHFEYTGFANVTPSTTPGSTQTQVAHMNYRGTSNNNYYRGFFPRSVDCDVYSTKGMNKCLNESNGAITTFFGPGIEANAFTMFRFSGTLWADPNE